jgi:uncharacterized protein (TIGR03790 family)
MHQPMRIHAWIAFCSARRVPRNLTWLTLLLSLSVPAQLRAQGPEHVLIIVNTNAPDSIQIGEYYQRKRRVPTDNLLRISPPVTDQITREVYERQIELPIATWINQNRAHDRVLYIVLAKGVPLRITGTGGRGGTVSSVDSELTLLYRRMTGVPVAPQAPVPNPYFLDNRPLSEARPFTHERFDIYLVTRLDGYSVADVTALIDRGSAAGRAGRIVLDQRSELAPSVGNKWLQRAADLLTASGHGDRVVFETTSDVVRNEPSVLGYYSWGSNDPEMKSRQNGLRFEPGALAGSFVSTDGRTFKEPPAQWTYGRSEDVRTHFAGSHQSMAGDLIQQGVTGVSAHVAEPYLDATIRPDVLFPAYLSGFTLAESYYLAMPNLSWQTVIVGDPLAAPFPRRTLAPTEIDAGIDAATELPTWFAARAVRASVTTPGTSDVAPLLLRARSRLARGDAAGATETLEQATARNPRLIEGHLMLAAFHESAGNMTEAMERYRRVLAVAPNHVMSLNNLAYAIGAHQRGSIAEAVAMARKANTLSPGSAPILDTLAWLLHLSGDSAGARPQIGAALRLSPTTAEYFLHAAAIDAAVGDLAQADTRLKRALALDPKLEARPEVAEVRQRLAKRGAR